MKSQSAATNQFDRDGPMQTRCVYQFERANVVGDEFVADAICVECEGTLTAKSSNNRTEVWLEIIPGEGKHIYDKRRRLTETRAKSLVSRPKANTVYNVYIYHEIMYHKKHYRI